MSLYVDTSVWYAAADAGDRSNARAKEILADEPDPLVTSDHVLLETWLLVRHRLGRGAAERFWGGLRAGIARVEPAGTADLEVAWSIGEAFPDRDFSLADRTSFAVMHRLGIQRATSFDDDFVVYRFGRDRGEAFSVIR
ncbi:MAG: PIN domain-containing protein [Gemmatimonadetes bacterium]|nr:PIN domain-containing protein [Gemmatimonadota bacterium]